MQIPNNNAFIMRATGQQNISHPKLINHIYPAQTINLIRVSLQNGRLKASLAQLHGPEPYGLISGPSNQQIELWYVQDAPNRVKMPL
jgi:hypothetical protein